MFPFSSFHFIQESAFLEVHDSPSKNYADSESTRMLKTQVYSLTLSTIFQIIIQDEVYKPKKLKYYLKLKLWSTELDSFRAYQIKEVG